MVDPQVQALIQRGEYERAQAAQREAQQRNIEEYNRRIQILEELHSQGALAQNIQIDTGVSGSGSRRIFRYRSTADIPPEGRSTYTTGDTYIDNRTIEEMERWALESSRNYLGIGPEDRVTIDGKVVQESTLTREEASLLNQPYLERQAYLSQIRREAELEQDRLKTEWLVSGRGSYAQRSQYAQAYEERLGQKPSAVQLEVPVYPESVEQQRLKEQMLIDVSGNVRWSSPQAYEQAAVQVLRKNPELEKSLPKEMYLSQREPQQPPLIQQDVLDTAKPVTAEERARQELLNTQSGQWAPQLVKKSESIKKDIEEWKEEPLTFRKEPYQSTDVSEKYMVDITGIDRSLERREIKDASKLFIGSLAEFGVDVATIGAGALLTAGMFIESPGAAIKHLKSTAPGAIKTIPSELKAQVMDPFKEYGIAGGAATLGGTVAGMFFTGRVGGKAADVTKSATKDLKPSTFTRGTKELFADTTAELLRKKKATAQNFVRPEIKEAAPKRTEVIRADRAMELEKQTAYEKQYQASQGSQYGKYETRYEYEKRMAKKKPITEEQKKTIEYVEKTTGKPYEDVRGTELKQTLEKMKKEQAQAKAAESKVAIKLPSKSSFISASMATSVPDDRGRMAMIPVSKYEFKQPSESVTSYITSTEPVASDITQLRQDSILRVTPIQVSRYNEVPIQESTQKPISLTTQKTTFQPVSIQKAKYEEPTITKGRTVKKQFVPRRIPPGTPKTPKKPYSNAEEKYDVNRGFKKKPIVEKEKDTEFWFPASLESVAKEEWETGKRAEHIKSTKKSRELFEQYKVSGRSIPTVSQYKLNLKSRRGGARWKKS